MPRNKNKDSIDNYDCIYKVIPNTNGMYYVTTDGRVWTNNRKNGIERFMKLHRSKDGYINVGIIYSDGKQRIKRVHRLVAEAFIPNPNNKPYVNHIDGIRTNNNIENLEWCTQQENCIHAIYVLGHIGGSEIQREKLSKEGKKHRKLTIQQANEIRKIHKEKGISAYRLSKQFRLNKKSVLNIINNKSYMEE